ncbi:hypothetical protein QU38_00715, partial [Staphylococcus aureus]
GVVGAVHLMRRGADMQAAPGLVEPQVGHDVRHMVAALGVALEGVRDGAVAGGGAAERAEQRVRSAERGVDDAGRAVGLGVFERQRRRHAVAELGGVGELRNAGVVVRAGQGAGGGADDRLRQRPLRIEFGHRLA